MQSIINLAVAHIGLSILGGSTIGAVVLHLAAPKITAIISTAFGKMLGKEIAAAETIKTGDPEIDARLNLIVLILMDVANRALPAAPGEDKKKYVMSFFANTGSAIQAMISTAIDQLWATMKESIDKGLTAPQEVLIEEAVAKLKTLAPVAAAAASVIPPAPPTA
ncbi:MAG: hypothetical protein NTX59_08195 [Elusimicrobia bacterium]|nr:hypothetical protein [Elusimicrobiota bacterium]